MMPAVHPQLVLPFSHSVLHNVHIPTWSVASHFPLKDLKLPETSSVSLFFLLSVFLEMPLVFLCSFLSFSKAYLKVVMMK